MSIPLPTAELHYLSTSDGSALYTSPRQTHRIICSVSYPLEVPQRSNELPTDTLIEVNVRPHNAVGGVKERHVEQVIQGVLHSVVLGQETPRTLLQVGLQVAEAEEDESLPGGIRGGGSGQGDSYLDLLTGYVNAAVLGCLDAGVQMKGVLGCVIVGVRREDGEVLLWPDARRRKTCSSLHVFAYGRDGECLLIESEGMFSLDELAKAEAVAKPIVVGRTKGDDVVMDDSKQESSVLAVFRACVEERVAKNSRWRG